MEYTVYRKQGIHVQPLTDDQEIPHPLPRHPAEQERQKGKTPEDKHHGQIKQLVRRCNGKRSEQRANSRRSHSNKYAFTENQAYARVQMASSCGRQ